MVRLSRRCVTVGTFWSFLVLQACQTIDSIPKDDSLYAPVEAGRYWVYEVQDETYSLSTPPVLNSYFLKETVGELVANQADKTHKLIRYKRSRPTDVWKTDSIWTVQQWPNRLMRIENSIAFIKLLFPVVASTSWNQNEYNRLSTATYQYVQIGKDYAINGRNFANTVQVINKQNDSTAISLNRQVDVYAYQIGLIFKENTVLAYCQSSPDCLGKGQIAYGYRRKQWLVETGLE
ncbi:hypothetical protein [Spirosoma panaciterrae]|uniref:hypothetical protein n=1 Tax=Spirosoma panaciterrae TaxID=496058 RepID=UPI0003759122|nr:hypothetical protein [Spirosoma panaciterrae]